MKKSIALYLTIFISLFFLSACQPPNNNQDQTSQEQGQTETQPEVKPQTKIEIKGGNLVAVGENDEAKIIADKNDFEEDSIENFISVETSPDQSKICFIGQSIVPEWLYIADIDGSNVQKITVAQNCVWSHDSQKIAYNNQTTDVSPVDVYVYDLSSQKSTNYTKGDASANKFRSYQQPEWSDDDQNLTSAYTVIDFDNMQKQESGEVSIDLNSGKINEI